MSLPKLSTRRLALLSGLSLFAVLGVASVCDAESPWRRRVASPVPPPAPPPYTATLEDPSGSPLPTFRQAGTTFVLGESGERYNIRVFNPTGERVEAVVTVDGRDAISGEVGDYVTARGYLIEPWGSVVVEGFRRSLDEVAAFRFTGKPSSYSALRGTAQHVGVIGVAVFPEKPRRPLPLRTQRRRDLPSSAPRASGGDRFEAEPQKRKSAASNIGTEYGESQSSSVVEVAFERRSPTHPAAVLKLRYDDYDGLEARGIDLSSLGLGYASREAPEPEPFPLSRSRFAPPP